MSKFQDLLNGRIPKYSEAFIIPVTSLCEMGDVSEKENWVQVKCRRIAEDRDIIAFAKENGYHGLRVAVGFPYCDVVEGWWIYKVWTR